MPFSGDWYIPYSVIEVRFWGKVDVHDLDQFFELCVKLLTEAQIHAPDRRLHLVVDGMDIETMPPTYLMIARTMPMLRFKNRDRMFLITQKSTTRSILELTAHVMNFPMSIFNTRDEALQAVEALIVKNEIHS
jgi:hypothetical protein